MRFGTIRLSRRPVAPTNAAIHKTDTRWYGIGDKPTRCASAAKMALDPGRKKAKRKFGSVHHGNLPDRIYSATATGTPFDTSYKSNGSAIVGFHPNNVPRPG